MRGGMGVPLGGVVALLQQEGPLEIGRQVGDLVVADGVHMPGVGKVGLVRFFGFNLLRIVKVSGQEREKGIEFIHDLIPPCGDS